MTVSKSLAIVLCCIIVSTCLVSCLMTQAMQDRLNGHFYKYKFAIREASKKKSFTFSNDIFSADFAPHYTRVGYTIHNSASSPITLLWDKAYIVIHTDSSRVIPSSVTLQNKDKTVPPLILQPGEENKGFMTPIDYIANQDGKWYVKAMYPDQEDESSEETDWIMGLLGVDIFKLYLPVSTNHDTVTYKFTFYPIEMEKAAVSQVPTL